MIGVIFGIALISSVGTGNSGGNFFGGKTTQPLRYDQLVTALKAKDIKTANWQQNSLTGELKNGTQYVATVPEKDSEGAKALVEMIVASGAEFQYDNPPVIAMVLSVL